MSPPPEPSPHGDTGRRQTTCLVGVLIFLGSGIVLVAVGSLAAFLLLPRLIQGPLDLGHKSAVGRKLAELRLEPLTGSDQPVTLEDLSGQVVVVHFWSTGCGPCLRELPQIARLRETFDGWPGFRLLAVSCAMGGPEDAASLRGPTVATLRRLHVDMPTWIDPGQRTRRALDALERFRGYPTTLVLDHQGVVRGLWAGADTGTPGEIEQLVGRLLAEPLPASKTAQ